MNEIKEKIKGIIPAPMKKYSKYLIVIFAAAVFMLICFWPSGKNDQSIAETKTAVSSQDYAKALEESVANTVKSVVGGKPQVMITLKSGVEYVYANEEKLNSDEDSADSRVKDSSEKKVVVLDADGKQVPLTVTEIMPNVRGVVIVCNGGNDQSVQSLIKKTVSVALGVETDCVCVTGTLIK